MERERALATPRDENDRPEPRRLISQRERQALRWFALGVVLFFVAFVVGFIVANS